jgi:hypothetical protein
MPADFFWFLARSLQLLKKESRENYVRLASELGTLRTSICADAKAQLVYFDSGEFVVAGVSSNADIEVVFESKAVIDLIDGKYSFEESLLRNDIFIKGNVDALERFHSARGIYLNGALRAPSFPMLLLQYRRTLEPGRIARSSTSMRWGQWDYESDQRERAKRERKDHTPFKRDPEQPPLVTIFGAGVTGLTAAHELVVRGFNVQIVEPKGSPTEEYACQVGGMAANQLGRVKVKLPQFEQLNPGFKRLDILRKERGVLMQPVQRHFPLTQRIRFVKACPKSHQWPHCADDFNIKNSTKLNRVLQILREAFEEYTKDWENQKARLRDQGFGDFDLTDVKPDILQVKILGYTDSDGFAEQNRAYSRLWAKFVKIELLRLCKNLCESDKKYECFCNFLNDRALLVEGRGAAPLGDQLDPLDRERSNRVEFLIVEQVVPGEHGFRFFPSFYRHLFDTMKRTPVFDKRGDQTLETADQQLVDTPDALIGFSNGEGLLPVKFRRFTTIQALRETIEFLKVKAEFSDRDVLRLQTHFLKYLTSCKQRRTKEAENCSLWEYIGADRVNYSDGAEVFIRETPQALVAMSAEEADARTQYNSVIQLLVDNPLERFIADRTLNGTTSEAWLRHWKDYLKRMGVKFFIGRLEGLRISQSQDGYEFMPTLGSAFPEYPEASNTPDIFPEDPKDWDKKDPKKSREKIVERLTTDPDFFLMAVSFEEASRLVWEAYSQIRNSPVQIRFNGPFEQLRQFDLYTHRRDPSTNAVNRDRDPLTGRPTNPRDPLRDISGIQYFMPQNYRFGNGHVYYPKSPWALSSVSQLAFWRNRTWPIGEYIGQVSFDIGNWYRPGSEGTTAWNSNRQHLAEETWKQASTSLETLYALNLITPQYYHLDQGISFDCGTHQRVNANPYIINVPGQWSHRPGFFGGAGAGHGGRALIWYAPPDTDSLFRRWVPAGTYMATYTRLTTMEAANESARHAVNAILHTLLEPPDPHLVFNGQGTLVGDLCDIWDPEDYELQDLKALKELDAALFREGLPHVLDIFRVIEFLEHLPEDVSIGNALEQIRRALEGQLQSAAAASLIGLDVLESAMSAHIQTMRALLHGSILR